MASFDEKKSVLLTCFPSECEEVGSSNIDDIVAGDITIKRPAEGRQFDYGELFQHLTTALTFIVAVFRIKDIATTEFARKLTDKELSDKIDEAGLKAEGLALEKKKEVIKAVNDSSAL